MQGEGRVKKHCHAILRFAHCRLLDREQAKNHIAEPDELLDGKGELQRRGNEPQATEAGMTDTAARRIVPLVKSSRAPGWRPSTSTTTPPLPSARRWHWPTSSRRAVKMRQDADRSKYRLSRASESSSCSCVKWPSGISRTNPSIFTSLFSPLGRSPADELIGGDEHEHGVGLFHVIRNHRR